LLGRCSTTPAIPQHFFALVTFQVVSRFIYLFCLGPASDFKFPTYVSHIAGATGMYHSRPACLNNFLLGLASNHNPPNLWLPSSWEYRRELRCLVHSNVFHTPKISQDLRIVQNAI
jgi:hypothetical protein